MSVAVKPLARPGPLTHVSFRRIREALWAYHRGLERLGQADETLGQMMQTNLSRRAIRTSVPDEMGSFVRWWAGSRTKRGRSSMRTSSIRRRA